MKAGKQKWHKIRDQGDGLPLRRPREGNPAALGLAGHPRGDQFLSRRDVRDQLHVTGVAHDAVAGRDGLLGSARPV